MFTRLTRAAAMTIALIAVVGCGSDSTVAPAPVEKGSLTIGSVPVVYEADAVVMSAVYKNAAGVVVPNTPIVWTVSDTLRAMQAANGYVLALKSGVVKVTATSNGVSASTDLNILRAPVQDLTVFLPSEQIAVGDVMPTGVRVGGPGGRVLTGRSVAITSDNPAVATIDASGRVRAVGVGTANIRATAEGVTGASPIRVLNDATVLTLSKLDGKSLPLLMSGDSVTYEGKVEYHEVYVESGLFRLSGSPLRYSVLVKFAEYNVAMVNGQRVLQPRYISVERDDGLATYDNRGDFVLTSEITYPLGHKASSIAGGMQVTYRIPGTDEYMNLFFRREPQ